MSLIALPHHARFYLGLGVLVAWMLISGCASSKSAVPGESGQSGSPEAHQAEQVLREHTLRWEATPYQWGGMSRSGIDCSGFASVLYRDALNHDLPRTTSDQARTGRRTSPDALQPGDLVFFRPAGKQRHVGVYLRDGTFAHASVSEGVTISKLDASYWQRSFWMARRVLPDFTSSSASAGSRSSSSSPSPRSGW
jgi:cell wall-associated NlpC family hydrolase